MKFKLEDMLFVRPPMLHFEVEDRCNMSCPMCITMSHRHSSFDRLTLPEIKSLLLARFRFAGGRVLNLTGGEPTLSEDLEETLKYGNRIGLSIVLNTNLYQTSGQKMQRILYLLKDSRHKIVVSYDSASPEDMKAIRGVDAHDNVTTNLEALIQIKKDIGAKTNITACLTLQDQNCRSIVNTVNYLTRLDLNRIFIMPIHLYGEINETNFHLVNPPFNQETLPYLFDAVETVFLLANKNSRIGLCYADIERWRRHFLAPNTQEHKCQSDRVIFVSRHGDYRGCNQSRVYANIREIGIVDFLKSEIYMEHRRFLIKCNICTQACS